MAEPDEISLVSRILPLEGKVEEDVVWNVYVGPLLEWLPSNVQRICYYGFTEILNNAIDHSEGKFVYFSIHRRGDDVRVAIRDDGIGIFEKLKSHFKLEDHRQTIMELAKGKLTTDKARHTGEGIFFTSRMFDNFAMIANQLEFRHTIVDGYWLIEARLSQPPMPQVVMDPSGMHLTGLVTVEAGTWVIMDIASHSTRTLKEVFDMFADPKSDDYTFSKTHVPLRLAQHGSQQLISRSEAKRVLNRFEGFREILLDFTGIESIGQAFADEIFRVFQQAHPEIKIVAVNPSEAVSQMINRARAHSNLQRTD